jgi:hypothetical protein
MGDDSEMWDEGRRLDVFLISRLIWCVCERSVCVI